MADSEKSKLTHPALTHPHDLLVRTVLADADIAADLFRNYLDPDLVAAVDFDSLKRETGDTVSPGLSKLVGDLRYSARFVGSDEELNVVVLLEHQSGPDRLMAWRLLEYVVAAYRQHVPALKKGGRFPYPLAVVLHHGPRPWKRIPAMRDLISPRPGFSRSAAVSLFPPAPLGRSPEASGPESGPGISDDILALPISLIDAAAMRLDDLPGHPVVCALLDSLQSTSAGRLAERVAGVFGRLQTAREDGRLKDWVTSLATYYGAVEGYTHESVDAVNSACTTLLGAREAETMTVTIAEHYRREGEARVRAEVEKKTITFAQSWIEEGFAKGMAEGKTKGKAEGMAEGKAKGKAEGKAEVVRTALRENLPVSLIANLTGLSVAEVERMAGEGYGG